MRVLTALIGGLIGGLIGAAIWAGISYATGYEIGWIAWGVGFLVGMGVRMGAGDWEGAAPGALAVILALLSVVGGKYAMASIATAKLGAGVSVSVTADNIKSSMARDIVEDWTKAEKKIAWPAGKSADNVESLADFPADVQKEVSKRWDALSPAEQQQKIAERQQAVQELRNLLEGTFRGMAFWASFGIMDLLFFGLAAFTAFKLGSGADSDDE